MTSQQAIGKHLWAHCPSGFGKVNAIECLLCKDVIYRAGPEPYVKEALVKLLRLHFLLVHEIEAIDLPEVV